MSVCSRHCSLTLFHNALHRKFDFLCSYKFTCMSRKRARVVSSLDNAYHLLSHQYGIHHRKNRYDFQRNNHTELNESRVVPKSDWKTSLAPFPHAHIRILGENNQFAFCVCACVLADIRRCQQVVSMTKTTDSENYLCLYSMDFMQFIVLNWLFKRKFPAHFVAGCIALAFGSHRVLDINRYRFNKQTQLYTSHKNERKNFP